jgi:toxin ParE1/3/4
VTATRFIDRIMLACEPLYHFPLAAPLRDHLATGLRAGFVGSYAIYYLHDERHLTIVRVLHGARDVAALAENGAFAVEVKKP